MFNELNMFIMAWCVIVCDLPRKENGAVIPHLFLREATSMANFIYAAAVTERQKICVIKINLN
jgi:hypothetical protein